MNAHAIPLIPADDACEETDVYIEESDCELTDRYEESWSDDESHSEQGLHLTSRTEDLSTEIYPCRARRPIVVKNTSQKSRIRPRLSIFKKRLVNRSRGDSAHSSRSTFCIANDARDTAVYEHDAQNCI